LKIASEFVVYCHMSTRSFENVLEKLNLFLINFVLQNNKMDARSKMASKTFFSTENLKNNGRARWGTCRHHFSIFNIVQS
jgi:hypothetical protein